MSFPLLRAPQVVQTQILNECEPLEILILSMCSKKAYRLAKVHRKSPEKGQVGMIDFNRYKFLTMSHGQEKYANRIVQYLRTSEMPDQTEMINIGGTKVPASINTEGCLMTYWQDDSHGVKILTDYFSRLFNMSVNGIIVDESTLSTIDWITSRQESLRSAAIFTTDRKLTDEEVKHILTNCMATEELSLTAHAPADFRFTGKFQNHSVLRLSTNPWITLDNLKSMDSIDIHLTNSLLTSSDFNLFLKHWLAGGSRRLSFVSIQLQRLIFDEIFQDLTGEVVKVPQRRQFKLFDGTIEYLSDAYDIKRKDGWMASVAFNQQWNRHLCMFVWPAVE